MYMSVKDYLARITYTLEHVVAPAIESDFERGQVLASVFLLDQLQDRVDYKQDLIKDEIIMCCKTITTIMDVMQDTIGETQDQVSAFLEDIDQNGLGKGIDFRNQCDEMLCHAIDFCFRNLSKLDQDEIKCINDCILDYLGQINTRDFTMFKISTIEQLIQTKE